MSDGPCGQYFLVNNTVLNQNLSPVVVGGSGTGPRPVAAVYAASTTNFVRFSQPVISNANAVVTDAPMVEIVNATTGATMRSSAALEGTTSTVAGTARVNIDGRLLAVDAAVENAYMLTATGLSVIPLSVVPATDRPQAPAAGVANVGNYTTATAQNGLISIFGQNLGTLASAQSVPLPTTLGGTCVTINNVPAPLLLTSSGQITVQVPPELATGRYPMVVRSIDKRLSSQAVQVTVAKYAPALLTDPQTNRALVFTPNGEEVGGTRWAKRDEPLVLYAVGLGNPKGGVRSTAGTPASADKLAETDDLQLYFKKWRPRPIRRGDFGQKRR